MYEKTPAPAEAANPAATSQKRAAQMYKTTSHHGISGRAITAEVIRTVMNHLYSARDAYTANQLEAMCESNAQAIKILAVLADELQAAEDAFKDPEAAPAAVFLFRFYRESIVRIGAILSAATPLEEFDAIIDSFKPVYQAWLPPAPEAANDAEAPAPTNIDPA